jgi:hypothetical protein
MRTRNAKKPEILKSGRSGDWVYYVRNGKQCRRRYVVPKDPRTAKQLERRTAFGAASHAYSHGPEVTQEDRRRLQAAGSQVRSRPRLRQSGPLTGQQYHVGKSCKNQERGG